jgi:hypothetical protein
MSFTQPDDHAFCGCAEADAPEAPAGVFNRPALPAIAWRIGRFAGFRAAALRGLTTALPALTTRDGDDHAITLVELWAAMADVLTFHGERIANESYLRTAVHRDSVRRLVRLLDYRPFAGLAAETQVAFGLDPGATLTIARGTRLMSVPGQDELPAIYETLEEIAAEARLNRVRVRGVPVPHDPFAVGATRAALLAMPERLAPGDPLLAFWAAAAEEKTLARLGPPAEERDAAWSPPQMRAMPAAATLAKVERATRLFAHNAPASRMVFDEGARSGTAWTRLPGWKTVTDDHALDAAGTAAGLSLDGRVDGLKPGAALVADLGAGAAPVRAAIVLGVGEATETFGALTDKVTRIEVARQVVGQPALAMLAEPVVVARLATGQGALIRSGREPEELPAVNGAPLPLAGDPAVAVLGTRLDLVARGEGSAIWHLAAELGSAATFGAWTRLEGATQGRPVLLAPAAGRLELVVRGADDGIWLRRAEGGAWGGWIALGGQASGPVAAACSAAATCIVVRGPHAQVFANLVAPSGPGGWQRLPELHAAAELAVQPVGGVFAVFARGAADGGLRISLGGATGWTPWAEVPGEEKLAGAPAVVIAPGHVAIAARSEENRLLLAAWGLSGASTGWREMGGPIACDPVLGLVAGTRHLGAVFADGVLRMRRDAGTGWDDWAVQARGLGTIPDRRKVRLWQVAQPALVPRRHDVPATIAGSRVTVPLRDLDAIAAQRSIALSDGVATHLARVVGATPVAALPGEAPSLLAIDIAPPLPVRMDGAATVLLGNLARAGHGETQREEILGSGDAATPFQRFALRKAPVTRRAAAGALRGVAELAVLVDGEAWTQVETLFGRGPAERVYALEDGEDGTTILQFGDGVTGARLPTGAGNVRALYRTGLGLAGQVRAGQLSVLLTRPPGLRDAANPLPATGAADAEDAAQARTRAPGKVRSFGRAISLRDVESLALDSGLAAQARADWVWSGIERVVHLTVAGPGGTAPTAEALARLGGVLAAARDLTQRLLLGAVRPVGVRIAGTVFVQDGFLRAEVLAACHAAALARLNPPCLSIAAPVHRSAVIAAIQAVRGVAGLGLDVLAFRDDAGWGAAARMARDLSPGPLQPHLRIFPARPAAAAAADPLARPAPGQRLPRILGAEQATAAPADIRLQAQGGIA